MKKSVISVLKINSRYLQSPDLESIKLAEVNLCLLLTLKVNVYVNVKSTLMETLEVIPLEDAPYIKYKRKSTSV